MKITLCGSTRFKDQFEATNKALSKKGHIVYSVSSYGHSGDTLTDSEKELLDLVHFRKIIESDAIFVVGLQGGPFPEGERVLYVGDSTRREIAWAKMWGKRIFEARDNVDGYVEVDYTLPL